MPRGADRQDSFSFIFICLVCVRSWVFFCASRVCLGDMRWPGQCGCHVHGVSHSLHPLLHSHSNPAAQVCVGVCRCVRVCLCLCGSAPANNIRPARPATLPPCLCEHVQIRILTRHQWATTKDDCYTVFVCFPLNNVSYFEITRQQKRLCTCCGVKGSNYMLLLPAG